MPIRVTRRRFIAVAGSLLAVPTLHAQTGRKIPTIGVLWHAGSAEEEAAYLKPLLEGFRNLGYVEDRTIRLEHRFPNETPERFKSMAAELVSMNVDVLMAVGGLAVPYAKNATSTIPVVFMLVADPVAMKLVDSFARPGGNATGLSTFAPDLIGRRLQALKEMIPGLSRVAQLVNPDASVARVNVEATRTAAAALGITIRTFEIRSRAELELAFDAVAKARMQAVIVSQGEGIPFQFRAVIANLALARRVALSTYSRETFEPGALMSYGTDQTAICRRAAIYVDKILKGARASELPVEGPTKFEFLVNLKTAKAVGISVPPVVLARADEVVR